MNRTARRVTYLVTGLAMALLQGCGSDGDSSTDFPSAASAWNNHSAAFKAYSTPFGTYSTHNLSSWGYNAFGQLGINSTSNKKTPVDLGSSFRFAGFSVGSNHTLAFIPFRDTNSVYAWGYNGYGQLGNGDSGSTKSSATPLAISGLPNVTAVAAGGYHSMALSNYSSLYTWGRNSNGQLGINSVDDASLPQPVHDPVSGTFGHVKRIAAGGLHSIALKTDGTVWTWGSNNYGQLGDDSLVDKDEPVNVAFGGKPAKLIAAGGAFSVAVTTDNEIYVWGYNGLGQLGLDPATDPIRKTPALVTIPGIGTVKAVAAGLDHVLVMNDQGVIWAWGYNGFGQLGNGATATINHIPNLIGTFDSTVQVDGLSPILAIGHHSLAFQGRELKAWGSNVYGQLGDGTTTDRNSPVRVSGF